MKIGVVGLGFMGTTHLQAYQSIPAAEIVAVSAKDVNDIVGKLNEKKGNLDRESKPIDLAGAATYDDAAQLFADENVEAVDLCVPTHLHAPLTIAALKAGKHVLVEKPMGLSAAECTGMLSAAEAAQKVLMVAHVLRYFPAYRAARDAIASGVVGTVRNATFARKCAAPDWSPWLADRERSGGGVFDLLIHDFDAALFFFGKPKAVTATGSEKLDQFVDVVNAHVHYDDGPAVAIQGGWHLVSKYPFSMAFTVTGDAGVLEFHSSDEKLWLYKPGAEAEEMALPEKDGFEGELEAFVAACEAGTPPADCTPEDSATATCMALAMRDSREQGGVAISI